MKKYLILLSSILLSFYFPRSIAQNARQTLTLANAQMNLGNINEAIALYQRILFFDTLKADAYETCKKLAQCYLTKSDYQKTHEFLKMAYNLSPSDSIKQEITFQIVSLYLIEKKINYALIELFGLQNSENEYFLKRKAFYLGVAYYQKGDYEKSCESFIHCLDISDKESINEMNRLFELVKKYNKKYNPKTALTLSMIIPGTGQLLNGDIKGAVNSFLLSGGLIFLFLNTAIHYSFLDAGVSVLPWFLRYYQGGYENAEKVALAKRQKKIALQYQKIITLIENTAE